MSDNNLAQFKEFVSGLPIRALLNFRNYHISCGNIDCVKAINKVLDSYTSVKS